MTPTPTTSIRRQEASRANGAQSRGPITPEGKRKSSQNALRHGMLAQTVVLANESRERFDALLQSLLEEHQPITETENRLVEIMTIAAWKQMRFLTMETADLDDEIAKLPRSAGPVPLRAAKAFRNLADNSRSLDLNHRYQTACDRQLNRALRQLQELKRQRGPNQTAHTSSADSPTRPCATFDPDPDPGVITEPNAAGDSIFPNESSPTSELDPAASSQALPSVELCPAAPPAAQLTPIQPVPCLSPSTVSPPQESQ